MAGSRKRRKGSRKRQKADLPEAWWTHAPNGKQVIYQSEGLIVTVVRVGGDLAFVRTGKNPLDCPAPEK